VDLLYDEALIRGWYDDAAGKGASIPDRLLRWYLNRHANRMFAGSAPGRGQAAMREIAALRGIMPCAGSKFR